MEDINLKEYEKAREKCKGILEKFLEESESIPINDDVSSGFDIDGAVANYLKKEGHEEFLIKDISFGYMVGGIPENVLREFAQEKRTFDNKKVGKFLLKEGYAVHSVRYFEAHRSYL